VEELLSRRNLIVKKIGGCGGSRNYGKKKKLCCSKKKALGTMFVDGAETERRVGGGSQLRKKETTLLMTSPSMRIRLPELRSWEKNGRREPSTSSMIPHMGRHRGREREGGANLRGKQKNLSRKALQEGGKPLGGEELFRGGVRDRGPTSTKVRCTVRGRVKRKTRRKP